MTRLVVYKGGVCCAANDRFCPSCHRERCRHEAALIYLKLHNLIHADVSNQVLIPESDLRAWVTGTTQSVVETYSEPISSSTSLTRLTVFSHNDYLGLASHPEVCHAAAEAAQQVRTKGHVLMNTSQLLN